MSSTKDAGAKDAGSKRDARAEAPADDTDEEVPPTDDTSEDPPDDSTGQAPGTKPDASVKTDAGSKPDAATPVVDAGGGSADELPPCPSGWMCEDPAAPLAQMGISGGKVTDENDDPVTFACGNGGQVTCDPKNPKKSCPALSDPFCAHVSIPALFVDLYSCAQHCTP